MKRRFLKEWRMILYMVLTCWTCGLWPRLTAGDDKMCGSKAGQMFWFWVCPTFCLELISTKCSLVGLVGCWILDRFLPWPPPLQKLNHGNGQSTRWFFHWPKCQFNSRFPIFMFDYRGVCISVNPLTPVVSHNVPLSPRSICCQPERPLWSHAHTSKYVKTLMLYWIAMNII